MAYRSHRKSEQRKDMPHESYDTGKRVGRQGLSPDRDGLVARSDPAKPDRRAFGHVPDVGRARTKNEYGHDHLLADSPASVSKPLPTEGLGENGEWPENYTR